MRLRLFGVLAGFALAVVSMASGGTTPRDARLTIARMPSATVAQPFTAPVAVTNTRSAAAGFSFRLSVTLPREIVAVGWSASPRPIACSRVGIGLTCTGTVPRGRVGSMGRTSADLTLRAARAGVYSIGAHVSVMGDANAANDSGVVSLVVRPPPRTSP